MPLQTVMAALTVTSTLTPPSGIITTVSAAPPKPLGWGSAANLFAAVTTATTATSIILTNTAAAAEEQKDDEEEEWDEDDYDPNEVPIQEWDEDDYDPNEGQVDEEDDWDEDEDEDEGDDLGDEGVDVEQLGKMHGSGAGGAGFEDIFPAFLLPVLKPIEGVMLQMQELEVHYLYGLAGVYAFVICALLWYIYTTSLEVWGIQKQNRRRRSAQQEGKGVAAAQTEAKKN